MKDPKSFNEVSYSKPNLTGSDCPPILLASDNPRMPDFLQRVLEREGFIVQLARDYEEIEAIWREHRQDVVLLEVSGPQSVEAAVDMAIRLKTHDARQFVGYVADPILRAIGLDGDAIFAPRLQRLPQDLRDYFCPELPDAPLRDT